MKHASVVDIAADVLFLHRSSALFTLGSQFLCPCGWVGEAYEQHVAQVLDDARLLNRQGKRAAASLRSLTLRVDLSLDDLVALAERGDLEVVNGTASLSANITAA